MDGTCHLNCPLCAHSFIRVERMRRHLRDKHPVDGLKQWNQMVNTICKKCDKTFVTPESLEAHRQKEHTMFKCDMCQVRCTSAASLRYHRNMHSSKQRNHKCNVSVIILHIVQIIKISSFL